MRLRNRIFNLLHGVKRVYSKGSKNAGKRKIGKDWVIVKYDWDKPFTYLTKPIDLSEWKTIKKIKWELYD